MRILALISVLTAFIASPVTAGPLADAAEAKQWSEVETLLKAGADVRLAQPDGMTALHWSVFWDHPATVGRLLHAGADANAATRYSIVPLSIACQNGNAEIARRLLEAGADPNLPLPGGEIPLMTAARTGTREIVELLVEHGAEVDATERKQQTALMWAAAAGNVEAVDALVAAGAELQRESHGGFTAMMFAARQGRSKVVERLLNAGVPVNATMKPRQGGGRAPRPDTSALMLAVESGHFELALALVEAGADPNDQRSGYAPLHAVSWVRKANRGDDPSGDPPPRGSGNLDSLEFVRKLVAAGARVNEKLAAGSGGRPVLNPRGGTPFLFAARTADLPLMITLHELGADPLVPNVDGATPLMAAAGVGVRAVGEEAGTEPEVMEAIRWLIEQGGGRQRRRQEQRNRHARRRVSLFPPGRRTTLPPWR